ncbi:MAG: TIGR00153 family protein [Gammaproteobacteria bacterium]
MAITSTILNMFGYSPVRPLQKHIDTAHASAELLLPFFKTVLAQDWKKAEKYQLKIANLERSADQIKKEIRLHLPSSLFLPIPRVDLLRLLEKQDKIANKAKDIAGLMTGRRMQMPAPIAKPFVSYLQRNIDACTQAHKAIMRLDELIKTSFRGNEAQLIESMIKELDQIEHDTDEMQIALRKKLYDTEDELPPIHVMFLYKLIDWTGGLADCAQSVGGQLLLILAR